MTEEQSLLAAILAAPDEDTPRLAYADWLGENGRHDLAEFIRVQCELERSDRRDVNLLRQRRLDERRRDMWQLGTRLVGDPVRWRGKPWDEVGEAVERIDYLIGRERELLNKYGREWVPILPENFESPIGGDGRWPYEFRRGFVHSVVCSAADWLSHAEAIVWSPTAECGACRGTGWKVWYKCHAMGKDEHHSTCSTCSGTGRVPAPDPPTTHQPVKEVTFTDHIDPDVHHGMGQWWQEEDGSIRIKRLPGIRFQIAVVGTFR